MIMKLKKKIAYDYLDILLSLQKKYRNNKNFDYAVQRSVDQNKAVLKDYIIEASKVKNIQDRKFKDDEIDFDMYCIKDREVCNFEGYEIKQLKDMGFLKGDKI
jgi:hypothetical protein